MALSENDLRRYQEQGYLSPIRVLSAEAAAGYRRRLEGAEAEGHEVKQLLRNKPHLLLTFLDELVRHPAVLDAVEGVIGPNIFCWASSFFTKEPRTTDFISWHQDLTYWGLEPTDVVTDTFSEHNMLSRGQEIAVEVDEDQAVDLVLQPGEMSLHHVKLFHGSKPNRSADRRIGFAVRYLPTYVRQTVGKKDSALLVRGVDSYGHFEHEKSPSADLDAAALAHHKEVCERQAQILFQGTDRAAAR